jgi:COP9 signalosome complex subunit 12
MILIPSLKADLQARINSRPTDTTESAARVISKAFGLCMMDRASPPELSRKWGVYYIVGLILKCYFRVCALYVTRARELTAAVQVKRVTLSKNILRALDASNELPDFHMYPAAHRVTHQYYIGMLSFLNEDYTKVTGP